MPSLSFTRDHRGYEYTAIVHAGRRQTAGEQRILYWFRTPPGVKFGRVPIDEDVIRSLEEHNPGLSFDWDKILRSPQALPMPFVDPRERFRKSRRDEPAPPRAPRRAEAVPPAEVTAPPAPVPVVAEAPATDKATAKRKRRRRGSRRDAPSPTPGPPPPAEQGRLFERQAGDDVEIRRDESSAAIPEIAAAGQLDRDLHFSMGDEESDDAPEAMADEPRMAVSTAAGTVLGPEGLARLRTRCAEVMARISERVTDAERADALRNQAERLDPDTWVTADEVRDGLEHYEQVYQELRQALGPDPGSKRRGRHRRRVSRQGAPNSVESAPSSTPDGQTPRKSDDSNS